MSWKSPTCRDARGASQQAHKVASIPAGIRYGSTTTSGPDGDLAGGLAGGLAGARQAGGQSSRRPKQETSTCLKPRGECLVGAQRGGGQRVDLLGGYVQVQRVAHQPTDIPLHLQGERQAGWLGGWVAGRSQGSTGRAAAAARTWAGSHGASPACANQRSSQQGRLGGDPAAASFGRRRCCYSSPRCPGG